MNNSIWAIITSIVIGIGSNLLTPYVSKWLGNISGAIKKRNEQRKVAFENTVQFLLNNPHEEVVLRIRTLQSALLTGMLLILGAILMLAGDIILIGSGFLISILAYSIVSRANNRTKIIQEITKRKYQAHPNIDLS